MRMHECGHGRGPGHHARKMAKLMAMGIGGRGGWGAGDRGGRGGWGEGFDGPGRGRGGRGRMFAGGELRLLLLRLIADETRHGYELIKAIEELTGGAYAPSPGVVYPTLSLLVDEGLIAEAEDARNDGGARKSFTVTVAGTAELASRTDEAAALIERLTSLGERRERGDSPPIRRAIGNLFTALRQRASGQGFDTDTAHRIAEILDETARRIERL